MLLRRMLVRRIPEGDRMIIYKCPKCEAGRSSIHMFREKEIVSHMLGFNFPNRKITILDGKCLREASEYFACENCNFTIPVSTVEELFTWMDEHSFVELK